MWQETGDQQRSRGTEDFGGGVYTRDPVTDSRGERENESGELSTVWGNCAC